MNPSRSSVSSPSILLVHEDPKLLLELGRNCRQLGLQVRQATSVMLAMARLDEGLPDLICLDIDMPSTNGLSVCEMMATDPLAAQIPVIAICQQRSPETIRRGASMCVYYVEPTQLWRRVEPVIYELTDLSPRAATRAQSSGSSSGSSPT